MPPNTIVALSDFARDTYGLRSTSLDSMTKYGCALLAIAGGDGEVSKAEFDWLVTHQRKFGAPDEVVDFYRGFDHQRADLRELLSGLSADVASWAPAPHLVYHAIQMCGADGSYAEAERAKVFTAARTLGVPDDVVLTLHALVAMEKAVYDMRAAIFHISVVTG